MDAISNLIVGIRNASAVGKESTTVPYSKMKEAVLTLLEKEGYVTSFAKKGKKVHKSIDIMLAYGDHGPKVTGVQRVSKLSKRLYSGAKELKSVKQGHGLLVISTPKGILSDSEARKQNVGGELLFKIW